MRKYHKYKDSGIEWIGEIPQGWEVKKLKFVCEITYGISPPDTTYNDSGIGKILINGPAEYSLTEFGLTRSLKWTTEPKKSASKGSLLFCLRGSTTGRMNITHSDVSIGRGVCSLNSIGSQQFLIYSMLILRETIQEQISGSTFPSVTKDDVDNYLIPYPPLPEQQKIVTYLDHKTTLIDQIISGSEKKIELLKEKRLSLIQDIILNSQVPRNRLIFGVDVINRPISRSGNTQYNKVGLYNWGRGMFKYDEELGDDLGDSVFSFIREGDLILSGQFSWEGAVTLVDEKFHNCIASHRFHILNGKENLLLSEYLWAFFTSQEGHFLLDDNSVGSAGRNRPLNIGKLLKEKIPFPDLNTQQKIKDVVLMERRLREYSEKLISLLKEYRQSLISELVTGKIKVFNE
jgi:type I restriction enzyme S subunit